MMLNKQRRDRKKRRGGGDVSAMDQQPAIVQRLSMEAQSVNVDALKNRDDHKEEDEDSESRSDLMIDDVDANGPDLNFEPKSPSEPDIGPQSPSEPDLHFEPKSPSDGDAEKKEEDLDADCKRYDEGSHSESSQMHDDDDESSSDPMNGADLPNGKEHEAASKDDGSNNELIANGDNVNEENKDLLQDEK